MDIADQIIHVSNTFITGNGNTIIGDYNNITGDNNVITGTHNHVSGMSNTINGSFNRVYKKNCNITGNKNVIYGGWCIVQGNLNTVSSNHNSVDGNNNKIKGMYNTINGVDNTINGKYIVVNGDFVEECLDFVSRKKKKVSGFKIFSNDFEDTKVKDGSPLACCICMDNQRCVTFVPCNHCPCCYTCGKKLYSKEREEGVVCPICRGNSHDAFIVYF